MRHVASVSMGLTLLMLIACSKKEAEQEPVVTVQTAVAQKGSITRTVSAEAVIFPRNQAAITPKISAPVTHFYVDRGDHVHRGQLLATLENRDLAASVTDNQGSVEQARAAYESTTRASLPEDLTKAETDAKAAHEALDAQQKLFQSRQELFQQGALPRKDLDQAAVALAQAKAQSQVADQHLASMKSVGVQQTTKSAAGQLTSATGKLQAAKAQLGYTEIRSPIDGVVADRPLWMGETPSSGAPFITVLDTSSVTARAHIPQDDAALLKIGDKAVITANGVDVPGKVTVVSPALDPGGTTVEVWVEAANKGGVLRSGSTVELKIAAIQLNNVVTIPVAALLKAPEGAASVMVVGSDSRAHQIEVETGIQTNDSVQITKGLNPGQTVVTTGAYGLPDNTKVQTGNASAGSTEQKQQKPSAEKD